AHLERAALRIEDREDEGDPAGEPDARVIGELHPRLAAEPQRRALVLVEVGLHPDLRQIGDREEVHPRLHLLALEDLLGSDVAGAGRRTAGPRRRGGPPAGRTGRSAPPPREPAGTPPASPAARASRGRAAAGRRAPPGPW